MDLELVRQHPGRPVGLEIVSVLSTYLKSMRSEPLALSEYEGETHPMSVESSGSLRTACPKDQEERNCRSVSDVPPLDILP